MKRALALAAIVLTLGMTAALDAEAKRLGGGKSAGMQRQNVTQPTNPAAPTNTANPSQGANAPAAAAAPGAAAAATPKRSWMGPIAGLAAGLGLAALASHFGFGEALANIMTMVLIGMVVLFAIGYFMRKRAAAAMPAAAGGAPDAAYRTAETPRLHGGGSMIGSRLAGATPATTLPAGFDAAAFERNAIAQFMALQSANDAGNLESLKSYLTPEMFESVRAEVAERGGVTQSTQVFGLQASVVAVAEEGDDYIVSVRFTGSVREQADAVPQDLDEVWHLTKPRTGFGGWVVAGIQQAQ